MRKKKSQWYDGEMEAHYKGFVSKIFFSSEASGFYGEVVNIEDHIAFQAETTQSIMTAMQDAIDRYLHQNSEDGLMLQFSKK